MTGGSAIRSAVLVGTAFLSAVPAPAAAAGSPSHPGRSHAHHGVTEVPGPSAVPRVELRVVEDAVSGWNVYADVTHFKFAAKDAGSRPVMGEGHGHLHLDGVKVARVYGTAFHLSHLEPGIHEIEYSLHANDHSAYVHEGEAIAGRATVEVPPHAGSPAGHMHRHGAAIAVPDGQGLPAVEIRVDPDPESGWNLHADLRGFTFTPESVGAAPSMGQGHGHLHVDGRKVARLYTSSYHLVNLAPGTHEIKLTLHADNHAPFTRNGVEIAATATVHVESRAGAAERVERSEERTRAADPERRLVSSR